MQYRELAKELLIKHEGYRERMYKDSLGIITIGIGHNIQEKGLRPDEIDLIFENDLNEAEEAARKLVPNFENLSDTRKGVILDISFNLGETKFRKFVNTLKAIREERWEDAARGFEDSLWYRQVGNRAKTLMKLWIEG